jgi:hypothetical protein
LWKRKVYKELSDIDNKLSIEEIDLETLENKMIEPKQETQPTISEYLRGISSREVFRYD